MGTVSADEWQDVRANWSNSKTMSQIPLGALRAFAAVYEAGGVRAAARTLHITHSALSRYLRELETWLGVPLLEPRGGGARLKFTVHGDALGRAASASLTELARAVDAVRELRRAHSVAIATTASFGARWLLPRLPPFQRAHPWIETSIIAEQSVLALSEQGADLAIRMGPGPWPDGDTTPLMDDALYPVATRGYWASLGERSPARTLQKARLLHDRDPSASWGKWFAEHKAAAFDWRVGPRFTSSDLVLRAAAQGLGVALARDRLAADDIAAGRLVRPFGALSVDVARAYWLVLPKGGAQREAEIAMTAWLKEQAAAPPLR